MFVLPAGQPTYTERIIRMHSKKGKLLIIILCAAVLTAAAVSVLLLTRGKGERETNHTRTAEEAGITVESGLTAADFADNPTVAAWLEKCSRSDRDDQDAYALRRTDTAPDGTVTCTWLVLRRNAEGLSGQPAVSVSEARGGEITVTLTYTEGSGAPVCLCRLSGSFDTVPDLEVADALGILVSVTNEPF